jgi:hypothetical protein
MIQANPVNVTGGMIVATDRGVNARHGAGRSKN